MPLSWNEIRTRAMAFARDWKDESSEDANAKTFWDGFFNVFGVTRRRVATFEEPVKKQDGKNGYIDLLWKGVMVVEHKSRGKDLDKAYTQALDYFQGIKERDLPKYVVVSDFARIRLYNLEDGTHSEFPLSEFHKNIKDFGFIAGYQSHKIIKQDPVNIKAAERMGALHDQMKSAGYTGHHLELYLVRLLFCLFSEDTGIFEKQQFQEYLEQRTNEDGSDLAQHLGTLFHVLNTEPKKRLNNLDEQMAAFPYINGKLFEELLPPAGFDSAMRQALLDCCAIDWSRISPAIFGSLFQSIMDKKARRNLGAHYTSEENILKLIKPLFLDALHAEFNKVKGNRARLIEFHNKLHSLKFLDPACGCGNFLVIAYRELRLLELKILEIMYPEGQQILNIDIAIKLNVDQVYGIEIEEFPAQIAQVAMWLIDHQMNLLVSERLGMYFARIPLLSTPNIVHGNALQLDWETVVSKTSLTYILGNPPFIGHHLQTEEQKKDLHHAFGNDDNAGVMDYVSAWYCKAASYISGTTIRVAFVSTNSITQGEQVGILWRNLMKRANLHIQFAHRTFKWSNEASGKAAVYCVIICFGEKDIQPHFIYEYDTPTSQPHEALVSRINAYLVDGPWVLLENRSKSLCAVPQMMYGSKPTDGGFFFLNNEEKEEILDKEPQSAPFIRRFIGTDEYLYRVDRWVIWLVDADPSILKTCHAILERVKQVQAFRGASKAASTRNYQHHQLFRQVTQPDGDYILIPCHTSENRNYIPFGFMKKDVIVGNSAFSIPRADLFHFGIISSAMHMSWVRHTCGRLESRYRYSKDIVYNNFPWPTTTDKQYIAIETAAKGIIAARKQFPQSCPAELYDPQTMPASLRIAHTALDKTVDFAYGKKSFKNESERIAFLFGLYDSMMTPLMKQVAEDSKSKCGYKSKA